MNAPAFLQNRKSAGIGQKVVEGLGAALPPHVSIRGNRFTLVDGGGNEQPLQTLFMDGVVIDVSDVTCKMYFENDWEPGSTDPPTCWSANGVAPSIEALDPQSSTCATCPKNERGSAVSKMTGAAIKACRDEKWLAWIVPGINMPFQFRLTPGSFKNFRAYFDSLKPYKVDLSDIMTRVEFEADKSGVLKFSSTGYMQDKALFDLREAVLEAKATDALVGRNDRPRMAALPAPQAEQVQPTTTAKAAVGPFAHTSPPGQGQLAPSAAGGGQPEFGSAPTAATISPSDPAAPVNGRRTRGRRAAPAATQPAGQPQQPAQAPFAQPAAAAAPAPFVAPTPTPAGGQAAGASFGVQGGVPPNPEINNLLNSMFGPAGG